MDILITGGTGAFGQALTEKLLTLAWPKRICIYSRDEHKQEQMKKRFNYNDDSRLRFFIGDVRDHSRLAMAMRGIFRVVHAAALKVVPSGEYNPFEHVKTNILGAQNVIECMLQQDITGMGKVIALSTDKAVHPVNLYGATKLAAEKLFKAANNIRGPGGSKFSIVRYGNVSNSTGSVIPLFLEQIKNEQQLTLTHPDMTRFWITLDEAVNFTIRALDEMHGGEVFVPSMPSYSVKTLGTILYKFSGFEPEDQWFVVTGKRPGEKLHECIISEEEAERTTTYGKKGFVIKPDEWKISSDTLTHALTSDLIVHQLGVGELAQKLRSIGALQCTESELSRWYKTSSEPSQSTVERPTLSL